MKKKLITSFSSLLLFTFSIYADSSQYCDPRNSIPAFSTSTRNLNPKVLALALTAYNCAAMHNLDRREILTIIDYSLPSTTKRLWVLDLGHKRVLMNTLVAHGRGSGGLIPNFFSDKTGSHASSLGLFLTGSTYVGHDGTSLHLIGLEKGINDAAFSRNVVIHGAWYVSDSFAKRVGRLGLSWGCPAVSEDQIKPIINLIKNGTLVFAYYPDKNWLNNSAYLHCSSASYVASATLDTPSLWQRMKNFLQNHSQ